MQEFYENLANAIIQQAAEDYRDVLLRLKYAQHDSALLREKRDLERFFHSGWYCLLTNLDPEVILQGIQREVKRLEAVS